MKKGLTILLTFLFVCVGTSALAGTMLDRHRSGYVVKYISERLGADLAVNGAFEDITLETSVLTGTDSDMSGANGWDDVGADVLDVNTTVAGKVSAVELLMPRITCNNKMWVKSTSETNGSTIDFIIGLYTYSG